MHESVLLHEAVAALRIKADGIYVDGTFGRGGHSREILSQLSGGGMLLAFDKDQAAIAHAQTAFVGDSRLVLCHGSFAGLREQLELRQLMGRVDGILLDLGVSSPQLDEAERGFSFLRDGPLDMRMDRSAGISVADWLADADRHDIRHVLQVFGEEKFAGLIASRIVERREQKPFLRTADLAGFIAEVIPARAREKGKHPATRSFQALRIFINHELDDLQKLLADALDVLSPAGRLVIISFHSLEDRIVKHFVREQERGPQLPRYLPVSQQRQQPYLKSIGKPVRASTGEVAANVRARSAIMRVAEKVMP
ncbi:MAG TPA: 16S rRNA (cytosine(1402)-N(4))-methyltransferase RsmH [Pseudomonadales bacterium]